MNLLNFTARKMTTDVMGEKQLKLITLATLLLALVCDN